MIGLRLKSSSWQPPGSRMSPIRSGVASDAMTLDLPLANGVQKFVTWPATRGDVWS
jgi:hypothetical protein